ncbi:MAG: PDZ domain-containing protein [Planctomycetes bacterium]|nr:PDZ domain-containing protein [Planctomycetota bacterium]
MNRARVIAVLSAFSVLVTGCAPQPDGRQVYQRGDGGVTQVDRYHDPSSNTTYYETTRYGSQAEWQQSQPPDPYVVGAVVVFAIGKAIYDNWSAAPAPADERVAIRTSYPCVRTVDSAGIASEIGIAPGDIIIEYNGISLHDETSTNDALKRAISTASPASTVSVKLIRNGNLVELQATGGRLLGIKFTPQRFEFKQ